MRYEIEISNRPGAPNALDVIHKFTSVYRSSASFNFIYENQDGSTVAGFPVSMNVIQLNGRDGVEVSVPDEFSKHVRTFELALLSTLEKYYRVSILEIDGQRLF